MDQPRISSTVFFSAPSISPIQKQDALVGQTISFPIEARNFTGDGVTIKCEPFPLPKNANFVDNGGGKGVFTFTPDKSQIGAYDFVFTASDGIQQLAQSVIVNVEAAPVTKDGATEIKAGAKSLMNPSHDERGKFSSGGAGNATYHASQIHKARSEKTSHLARLKTLMNQHHDHIQNHNFQKAEDLHKHMSSVMTKIRQADNKIAYHQKQLGLTEARPEITAALTERYRACGLSAERAADLASPPDSDPEDLEFFDIVVPEFVVGKPNSFQVSGHDEDGDPVEINAESGTIPPWAEYDKDTGVFKGTPTAAGSWKCTFILTDGVQEARKSVTVKVEEKPARTDEVRAIAASEERI